MAAAATTSLTVFLSSKEILSKWQNQSLILIRYPKAAFYLGWGRDGILKEMGNHGTDFNTWLLLLEERLGRGGRFGLVSTLPIRVNLLSFLK